MLSSAKCLVLALQAPNVLNRCWSPTKHHILLLLSCRLLAQQVLKTEIGSASVSQVDMEERFCSKVKELGCTCITISHRPALVAFHDLVLALDGEGGWSIHQGATGNFTEETIPEDGVAGNGGVQRSRGQDTADKARTKDAAAVLQGMRVRCLLHFMSSAICLHW